ncbi:DUF4123 domain-containing protein [Nannocystis bainbridge]|uniref:DUF4123 domain-containing protein n=1 Tax=Nannocystis bainbridge TaxID=2995303 RepID=A0ABT5DUT7_9BACT|nr:DUF4123 domain-containing protein [Nannocystis bainbridge]MDC0716814.1 DUF4123 domain-containing protein [Nannocystis bainbridge]
MSARGIVELCWGPQQGAKAVVTPGRPLTLGRDPAASLVLDDPTVAPVHAAVEWDGRTARLRHLGGPALTLLSGQAVTTVAPLEHAAWIRIGGTDLSFHVEALTPAPWSREPDDEVAAEAALAHLQRVPGPLFAVLDTACEPRIAELVRESVAPWRSLFDGVEGARLADAAPHVVSLSADPRLCADLVREGWGYRWGVLLTSDRSLFEVRQHLRKFLLVQREGTPEPTYFRFYDPGVLRVFLDTCTPTELSQWFGGVIRCHLGEDLDSPTGWWRFDAR